MKESPLKLLLTRQNVLFAGLVIAIIAGIVFYNSSRNEFGGEKVNPDSPATLVYADNVYQPTGYGPVDSQIAADMAYFARHVYTDKYNPDKFPAVNFDVSGKPSASDGTVSFEGKYERVKAKIKVTVRQLSNDRVETSITDTSTNKSINNELPSNSKINKYIATLPYKNTGYRIYFAIDTQRVTISLFGDFNETYRQAAVNELKSKTSEEFVTDANVDLYYTVVSNVSETNAVVKGSVLPNSQPDTALPPGSQTVTD